MSPAKALEIGQLLQEDGKSPVEFDGAFTVFGLATALHGTKKMYDMKAKLLAQLQPFEDLLKLHNVPFLGGDHFRGDDMHFGNSFLYYRWMLAVAGVGENIFQRLPLLDKYIDRYALTEMGAITKPGPTEDIRYAMMCGYVGVLAAYGMSFPGTQSNALADSVLEDATL